MPGEDDQLKLIASLTDQMSGPLKEINKLLEQMGKGSGSTAGQVTHQFREMSNVAQTLQRNLKEGITPALGAFGLAAGTAAGAAIGLAVAMGRFANQRKDWHEFGVETGFTYEQVEKLNKAAQLRGLEHPNTLLRAISDLVVNMREGIQTGFEGYGLEGFLHDISELDRTGASKMEVLGRIRDKLDDLLKTDPQKAHFFSRLFGFEEPTKLRDTISDALADASKSQVDPKKMEEYVTAQRKMMSQWVEFRDNVWTTITPTIVQGLKELNKLLQAPISKPEGGDVPWWAQTGKTARKWVQEKTGKAPEEFLPFGAGAAVKAEAHLLEQLRKLTEGDPTAFDPEKRIAKTVQEVIQKALEEAIKSAGQAGRALSPTGGALPGMGFGQQQGGGTQTTGTGMSPDSQAKLMLASYQTGTLAGMGFGGMSGGGGASGSWSGGTSRSTGVGGEDTPYTGPGGDVKQGDTPAHFATVRLNNPGAATAPPGTYRQTAGAFGSTGGQRLPGGGYTPGFPSPVQGAAYNMWFLSHKGYVGMTIGDAVHKWSGGARRDAPGMDPNHRITPADLQNPDFMVKFMKAIAAREAPGHYPMDDKQWDQAYKFYRNYVDTGKIPDEPPVGRDGRTVTGAPAVGPRTENRINQSDLPPELKNLGTVASSSRGMLPGKGQFQTESGMPKELIIHYTGGTGHETVADMLKTGRERGKYAQLFMDEHGNITRLVPEGQVSAHANAANPYAEGIEIASTAGGNNPSLGNRLAANREQQASLAAFYARARAEGKYPGGVAGHSDVAPPGHRVNEGHNEAEWLKNMEKKFQKSPDRPKSVATVKVHVNTGDQQSSSFRTDGPEDRTLQKQMTPSADH